VWGQVSLWQVASGVVADGDRLVGEVAGVDADDRALFAEFHGQRQADIAEADDGDRGAWVAEVGAGWGMGCGLALGRGLGSLLGVWCLVAGSGGWCSVAGSMAWVPASRPG